MYVIGELFGKGRVKVFSDDREEEFRNQIRHADMLCFSEAFASSVAKDLSDDFNRLTNFA